MPKVGCCLKSQSGKEHRSARGNGPAKCSVLEEFGNGHDLDARAEEKETEVGLSEALEVGRGSIESPFVNIEALEAHTIAFLLESEGGRDLGLLGGRVKDRDAHSVVAGKEDGTQSTTRKDVDSRGETSADNESEEGGIGTLDDRDRDIVRGHHATNGNASQDTSQVTRGEVTGLRDDDAPLAESAVDEDFHGMEIDDEDREGK